MQCRIDFFRKLADDASMRTPGSFAEEEVKRSFARCEAAGDFAETFYTTFMNASPAIAPFFAQTEFGRQRQLLRDSVYLMVTQDVSDPEMRALLDKLGNLHSRAGRNIAPSSTNSGWIASAPPSRNSTRMDAIPGRPLARKAAGGDAGHHGGVLRRCEHAAA